MKESKKKIDRMIEFYKAIPVGTGDKENSLRMKVAEKICEKLKIDYDSNNNSKPDQ